MTAEVARAVWDYDPETGALTWRAPRAKRVKAGDVAGYVNSHGYVKVEFDGRVYAAHRIAFLIVTGRWPSGDTDHRNLNKADNRWANLREASRSQNVANVGIRSDNSSGFRGVYRRRDVRARPWRAAHVIDGKTISLGSFATAAEAARAYEQFVTAHRGEFARCK